MQVAYCRERYLNKGGVPERRKRRMDVNKQTTLYCNWLYKPTVSF
jgi:hypothetical protein